MEIGTISAETYGNLLEHFRTKHPEYLAPLVLAGFAGLRRGEIHAQTWEDINLVTGNLRVTKGKKGTPARRLVKLCAAAVEWLMLTPDRTGPVCTNLAIDRIRHIARDAKFEIPENAFRHSFISHRVAATGNVAETSLVAGNSPDIIFAHYLELFTKAEGEAWFAIVPRARPAGVGEVIEMEVRHA
jgi:integrase